MDYNARMYDPLLARFIQPDDIVPDAFTPQSLNRFSYVLNDPVNLSDPSGHKPCWATVVYSCDLSSWTATDVKNEIAKYSAKDQPAVTAFFENQGVSASSISSSNENSSSSCYTLACITGDSLDLTNVSIGDISSTYINGYSTLGDAVQLIPTYTTPPMYLAAGSFFDFYGQVSVGVAFGQGPLNVHPDSIGYGSYAFTTDGYVTKDISGGRIALGGNTIENTATIGFKFSWETVGYEADYEQLQTGNMLLGRYEQISYRFESHPAGDLAAITGAAYSLWSSVSNTAQTIEQDLA